MKITPCFSLLDEEVLFDMFSHHPAYLYCTFSKSSSSISIVDNPWGGRKKNLSNVLKNPSQTSVRIREVQIAEVSPKKKNRFVK